MWEMRAYNSPVFMKLRQEATMRRSLQVAACCAVVLALVTMLVTALVPALLNAAVQQPPAAAAFSAPQAAAGQQTYLTACASCHQANLAGGNEAPPLAG